MASAIAQGQQQEDSSTAASESGSAEIGILVGSLLPNQISGVTEITGLGGIRSGFRIAKEGWAEAAIVSGNAHGQSWHNLGVDVRMDIPVENLVGLAYIGLDLTEFSGPGASAQVDFGGHVGGGIQAHLGGQVWTRADMKFGFSPGTSMMISLAFIWRFGESGQGGGG
jgi:hypothetical protein